jgi:hypothetical protein
MDTLTAQIEASLALERGETAINGIVDSLVDILALGYGGRKEQLRIDLIKFVDACISQGRLQVTLENTLKDGTQKS